jgi:hypothetical protein
VELGRRKLAEAAAQVFREVPEGEGATQPPASASTQAREVSGSQERDPDE